MTKRDELRERLKKSAQRKHRTVNVGGDEYVIRSLTMRERGENDLIPVNLKTGSVDMAKIARQKCELLCLSVVDDVGGEPIFGVSEWEQWQDVDASVTTPLLKAIDKLNEGEKVEDAVKNSETTGD